MSSSASIRPDNPEPMWLQAVNLIKAEIASGALEPGMRLPPERELCQQLAISRVTLRKALSQLVEQGVLRSSHGRGWYVAGTAAPPAKDWPNSLESFTETARRMGLSATSRILRAEVLPANLDEAERLVVAPGSPLFHLERVRLLDGVPIAVDVSKVPAHLAPHLTEKDFTTGSLYEELVEAGLDLRRADTTIQATGADPHIAKNLDIDVDKPILVMDQVVVDSNERPLFTSTIRYSGERYRLRTFFARGGA
jgi:DNA-binding GntR family transcriptional regulator